MVYESLLESLKNILKQQQDGYLTPENLEYLEDVDSYLDHLHTIQIAPNSLSVFEIEDGTVYNLIVTDLRLLNSEKFKEDPSIHLNQRDSVIQMDWTASQLIRFMNHITDNDAQLLNISQYNKYLVSITFLI